MRDRGSHKPSGGIADIAGGRAVAIKNYCVDCGTGLREVRKTRCSPCAAIRMQENARRNGAAYYNRQKRKRTEVATS